MFQTILLLASTAITCFSIGDVFYCASRRAANHFPPRSCGFLTTSFVEKSGEGLRYLSADNDYLWARPSCSRAKHNFECFPRCFTISAGTHVYISAEISRQDKKTDPKRCVMRNFISCCAE